MVIKTYEEFKIIETVHDYKYEHFEWNEEITHKIVAQGSYNEIIRKYNILKKNEVNRSNYKKLYRLESIGIQAYWDKYGNGKTDSYFKLGTLGSECPAHFIPTSMIREKLEEILMR